MVIFNALLTAIGLMALAFGYWGLYTKAGRAQYDEMAGIIPGSAFYLGILILVISAVIWATLYFRQ